MKTPATSALFERKTDPISGVGYYVLAARASKYQQGFYFVNNSMTLDGRYLWFGVAINPVYDGAALNLGYIDFLTDEIVLCLDVICTFSSVYVDPVSGDAYYTFGKSLYKRSPGKGEMAQRLCTVKIPGWVGNLATHLTRTSDKKHFFLDIYRAEFGTIQGILDIETGEFDEWGRRNMCLNHGQINPKDDTLALCACDFWGDLANGKMHEIPIDENGAYMRLWTVNKEGEYHMYPPRDNYATHEWWSADGEKIYYVNSMGIQRINLLTGEHICVHPCHPWHAHTTADEKYYVYDKKELGRYGGKWFRGCPASVRFYNAETDREITIVTEMPENGHTPDNQNNYHIDPHPRFTDNEKYIIFTTSELGGCDLAVAVVDELRALTSPGVT